MPSVGVLGGSFNPVHRGHLFVAQLAREAASLDEVLFVPAARPPHKEGEELAAVTHRLAMLRLALAGEPCTAVSEIELEDGGPRYSIETLEKLAQRRPAADLSFIMGLDSLHDFPRWRDPERILTGYRVIAVDRPGVDRAALDPGLAARCRMVAGNPFAISSTSVRERAARGLPLRHLVPAPVEAYIAQNGLYRREAIRP
jgi:nicotinate-nucleotide adenylyltransferase